MKFYYADEEGYENGPYDDAALAQLARSGVIGRHTMVRNHMMETDWREACRYDFLLPHLPPDEAPPPEEVPQELVEKYGVYAKFLHEKQEKVSGKYNFKVVPDYARFFTRINVTIFDLLIYAAAVWLGCMFMLLFVHKETFVPDPPAAAAVEEMVSDKSVAGTSAAETGEEGEKAAKTRPERPLFKASCTVEDGVIRWAVSPSKGYIIRTDSLTGPFGFVVFVVAMAWMFMYATGVGYAAQTPGMWYYGVMAVRPNLKPVLPFRGWCYTMAWILLGWTFIFCYFFMGMSLPEKLTGVRLVRISSKSLGK